MRCESESDPGDRRGGLRTRRLDLQTRGSAPQLAKAAVCATDADARVLGALGIVMLYSTSCAPIAFLIGRTGVKSGNDFRFDARPPIYILVNLSLVKVSTSMYGLI